MTNRRSYGVPNRRMYPALWLGGHIWLALEHALRDNLARNLKHLDTTYL